MTLTAPYSILVAETCLEQRQLQTQYIPLSMSAVTLSLRTLYSAVLGVEQGVTNVSLITAISYIVTGRTHFIRTAHSGFNSVQIRSDLFTFQAKFAGNYYSYMHTRIQSAYTWFGGFL